MLLTSAPPSEIFALGELLRAFLADEPRIFDALFDPLGPRVITQVRPIAIAAPLCRFGLAEGNDDWLFGCHRIRRAGTRLYVMELGDVREYLQDVWPETDALLAELSTAPTGKLLDVGTGCGIVAIEAAARGHAVVATDLYQTALDLARFNAALNGVDGKIEFRAGHLFDPVAGERFDRILTAPHYTRMAAQLRLEVLRDGPRHLAPDGKLVLATVLESEPGAPPSVIRAMLDRQVAEGARIAVRPIASPTKREWFTDARSDPPIAGLVSRHRYAITVENGTTGGIEATEPDDRLPQFFLPLARLAGPSGRTAVISTAGDLARLRAILDDLARGDLAFDGAVPEGWLDACRFGSKKCADAAGAILDGEGGIRPCPHGGAIGRATDPMSAIVAMHKSLSDELERRRGCANCSAQPVCSRCLFPASIDEAGYCDLIRAHAETLPRLHRLADTLQRLTRAHGPLPSLRITIGHRQPIAAEEAIAPLVGSWRAREAWLIVAGERRWLSQRRAGTIVETEIDERVANLAARIAVAAREVERRAMPRLARLLD